MKSTSNSARASKRIYRGFALLSLFLASFAAAYSWISWRESKTDALRHATELVDIGEKSLNAYFSQIENLLRLASQDLFDEYGRIDPIVAHSRLNRLKNVAPDLANASIITLDGIIVVTSIPDAKLPTPVGDIASFNAAVAELSQGRNLNIGRPYVGTISKEWVIPVRYAIRHANGDLRYVLTATLPLSRPQSFWKDAALPARVALGLMRDDGYLVSRYPVPAALSLAEVYRKPRTGALIKHLQERQFPVSGYAEGPSSLDGPSHLIAFRRLSNHPLTLFLTQPVSNIHASWWSGVQVPFLLLLLLLAGGVSVFGWMLKSQAAWDAERNEAERTLGEARLRLGGIIESATDAIISIDDQHRVVMFNGAAETMFGYPATAVMGQPLDRLIPGNFRQRHSDQIREFSEAGVTQRKMGGGRTVQGLRANGEEFPVEASISQVKLKDGALFTAILRDVTERKVAEATIREREAALSRFKNTLDQTLDCIFIFRADTLRFVYVNQGAKLQVGYTETELLGMTPVDIKPEFTEAQFREMLQPLVDGRLASHRFETDHRHKDGHDIPVEIFLQLVRGEGQDPVFVAVVHDISERRKTEQALVSAKETAELASRTKDSFLATMSHEIRTPLGGLLGMLELLALTPINDEQRETLQAARDSGQSLLRILNDILDWSKIEEGKLELALQPTSIARLVADVASTYARVASAKSVTLEQQVDVRLSPALIVDPLRLSQVLNNFVSNAIKFTHPGGRVEVRAELLDRRDDAEQVRFSVRDTGIGIPTEVQQRLFQRYSQESAETARMYGGTGLGLSICQRLADLLDGRIDLKSTLGQGSTFSITLTLPTSETAAVEHEAQGPREAAETAPAQPTLVRTVAKADAPVVLVVDDHPINRKLLLLQLGLLGCRGETAEDGRAALPAWRVGRFALIITDCHMPKMDGYALTRAIRQIEADEGRPRTPIFAWTANALAGEMEKCHAAGMDELLVKPADLTQLKMALSKWLPAGTPNDPAPASRDESGDAQTAPIDLEGLDKIAASTAEKAEILRDFLGQNRSDFAELTTALEKQDLRTAARFAHRMKGGSLMVGARELAAACDAMEGAARLGSLEGMRAAKTALTRAVERIEAHLSATTDVNTEDK